MPKVSRFSFEIENVGLEPLLCVPNAACCLNTSFSIKLLQRESNPRLRRDSPVYWPLYDEAIFLYADRLVPARIILFIKLSLAALDIDRVNGNDFVYRNIEHCSKDHHVVDRRHGCSVDPFVDRLRLSRTVIPAPIRIRLMFCPVATVLIIGKIIYRTSCIPAAPAHRRAGHSAFFTVFLIGLSAFLSPDRSNIAR